MDAAVGDFSKAQKHLDKAQALREAGNDLLNKGDAADACTKYDEALLGLCHVGGELAGKANELRIACHLNASLAHLRRGNLCSARDHANGALAIEPRNEKALFRRGSARAKLSEQVGHEPEVALALQDFEKVLEVNPKNVEAMKQVTLFKGQIKKEAKAIEKGQRETFKNMFKDGTNLYDDVDKDKTVAPKIHEDKGAADAAVDNCLLAVQEVSFHYMPKEPVLDKLSLELCRGRCVGLFGCNACGKSTFCRILAGKLSPKKGRIVHYGDVRAPDGSSLAIISVVSAPVVAVAAILGAFIAYMINGYNGEDAAILVMRHLTWVMWCQIGVAIAVVAGLIKLGMDKYKRRYRRHLVVHLSSEISDKDSLEDHATIEKFIGSHFQGRLTKNERRDRVVLMLKAGGFQQYDQDSSKPIGCPEEYVRDGLKYGQLSGGQKHLMYILRALASCPDALVCDEVLGGLDAVRQPRVLKMLLRMKDDLGCALLYCGTELSQLRLMCDSIGFMSNGVISELGPADQVLDLPKHPNTKEYIKSYRGLPGCHIIGGKLAENYCLLQEDADLLADWLPPRC